MNNMTPRLQRLRSWNLTEMKAYRGPHGCFQPGYSAGVKVLIALPGESVVNYRDYSAIQHERRTTKALLESNQCLIDDWIQSHKPGIATTRELLALEALLTVRDKLAERLCRIDQRYLKLLQGEPLAID
jgi:hypothetical protein